MSDTVRRPVVSRRPWRSAVTLDRGKARAAISAVPVKRAWSRAPDTNGGQARDRSPCPVCDPTRQASPPQAVEPSTSRRLRRRIVSPRHWSLNSNRAGGALGDLICCSACSCHELAARIRWCARRMFGDGAHPRTAGRRPCCGRRDGRWRSTASSRRSSGRDLRREPRRSARRRTARRSGVADCGEHLRRSGRRG